MDSKIDRIDIGALRGSKVTRLATDLTPMRTTFRVDQKKIEILNELADWMGISDREVLDRYLEAITNAEEARNMLATLINQSTDKTSDAERRSLVVSNRTLKILGNLAKQYSVSRDQILGSVLALSIAVAVFDVQERLKNAQAARAKLEEAEDFVANLVSEAQELLNGSEVSLSAAPEHYIQEDIDKIREEVDYLNSCPLLKHVGTSNQPIEEGSK